MSWVPVKCSHCPHEFGVIERHWSVALGESAKWRPAGALHAVAPFKGSTLLLCLPECRGLNGRRKYPVKFRRLAKEVLKDAFAHPVLLGLPNHGLPTDTDRARQYAQDLRELESLERRMVEVRTAGDREKFFELKNKYFRLMDVMPLPPSVRASKKVEIQYDADRLAELVPDKLI